MKALSIWQPWAYAIIHSGKDVENRFWYTSHRGPLLIHASKKKVTLPQLEAFSNHYGIRIDDALYLGGIIGQVDVVACVKNSDSRWAEADCYHWVFANPKPLPFMATRGSQGLFEVEYDVELLKNT